VGGRLTTFILAFVWRANFAKMHMDWSGYSFEWFNAFIGDIPPVFFVEIIGRTGLLFVFAIFLTRLLGKRTLGQLSPYEFVVLIAMGSALGDPMFYPNVPLLPPIVVMSTIVLMHRTVSWITERNQAVEGFIEGESCEVVRDGVTSKSPCRTKVWHSMNWR